MRKRDPIEDVLFTSVEQEIILCVECRDERSATLIQSCVVSGQCVREWRIQGSAFIALLKLDDVSQVVDYHRDFLRLCQHHRDAISSVRFSVEEDALHLIVHELVAT